MQDRKASQYQQSAGTKEKAMNGKNQTLAAKSKRLLSGKERGNPFNGKPQE